MLLSAETSQSTVQAWVDEYEALSVAYPMIQRYPAPFSQLCQSPWFCPCEYLSSCWMTMVWWEEELYPYSCLYNWAGRFHFLRLLIEIQRMETLFLFTLDSCRRRQLPATPTSWGYNAITMKQLTCCSWVELWFELGWHWKDFRGLSSCGEFTCANGVHAWGCNSSASRASSIARPASPRSVSPRPVSVRSLSYSSYLDIQ